MPTKVTKEVAPRCNLCGETTYLGECVPSGGLIKAVIHGGYDSTPGNGDGALDDDTFYLFSLCEFCCDWLMSQFKIPPVTGPVRYQFTDKGLEGYASSDGLEKFRPAAQRVREDEWRGMKKEFFAEKKRRDELRRKGAPLALPPLCCHYCGKLDDEIVWKACECCDSYVHAHKTCKAQKKSGHHKGCKNDRQCENPIT